ncbi:MAG: hypothetical protein KAJ24_05385 [Candidatus Aenigmarchaeota archaeon]|nr:hypothetical protein [Candidatus Aenigmarchaeota archaeon]
MPEAIKLYKSYTPHTYDKAMEISPGLVHILKYLCKNSGELFQDAIQGIEANEKIPDLHTLKKSTLIDEVGPINGLYTTDLGYEVLTQILKQRDDLCGAMLVVNTHPYPESINRPHVRAIKETAYNEAVKGK